MKPDVLDTRLIGDKDTADFLGWLFDHYPVPCTLLNGLDEGFPNDSKNFALLSESKLKEMISKAVDKGHQDAVDRLLEIASQKHDISDEITRRSIRVKSGEYLKLLTVKLVNRTSFSQVMISILQPKALARISELKESLTGMTHETKDRLDHLQNLVEKWVEITPDARSRAVTIGPRSAELAEQNIVTYDILRDQKSQRPEYGKPVLVDYALFSTETKLREDFSHNELESIYSEFREKWRHDLQEGIWDCIYFVPEINGGNTAELIFRPRIELLEPIDVQTQGNLLRKFSEDAIIHFMNVLDSSRKREDRKIGSLGEEDEHILLLINLPACTVRIQSVDEFDVECLPDSWLEGVLSRHASLIRDQVAALEKDIGIHLSGLISKYVDNRNRLLERSGFSDFIKIATNGAKDPGDYVLIREISNSLKRLASYEGLNDIIISVLASILGRGSVVSLYVSEDTWRFIQLILKDNDWVSLVNDYLDQRHIK